MAFFVYKILIWEDKYMIYEFKTHSIIIENPYKEPTFSLTIGTLEIVVDYDTKQIIYIQGFFPLMKAERAQIVLPKAKQGNFYLSNINLSNIEPYDIFSLTSKVPQCKEYYEKNVTVFDESQGIIQLGEVNGQECIFLQINDNLIIGHDSALIPKCIYIMPDKFIV